MRVSGHDKVFERSTFHLFFTLFFSRLLVLFRIKSTECRLTFQQHTKMENIKKKPTCIKAFLVIDYFPVDGKSQFAQLKLSLFLVL